MPTARQKSQRPTRESQLPAPVFIDVDGAAEILQVSSRTIRRWIRDGHLPAYRLRGRGLLRIRLTDLDLLVTRADPNQVSA